MTWVRGNADRELVDLARGACTDIPDPIAPWAAAQLRADHVDWLARLPYPVVLNVDGFGDVMFCHGTPRDDNEIVLADTRMDRWAEALAELPDHIHTVVCGHTHMPFLRLVHGREIVSPGSVGMPYGRPGAHWALLTDGAVSLRRTRFDPDHASVTICRQSSYPDVAAWTDYFLHARATDAEAIAIFGRRDGR